MARMGDRAPMPSRNRVEGLEATERLQADRMAIEETVMEWAEAVLRADVFSLAV